MIATMAKIRVYADFSVTILPMFSALMGVDWIVAVMVRLERKSRVEPRVVVAGVIVVTEVIVVVSRTHEKMVGKHGQADHGRRRVIKA